MCGCVCKSVVCAFMCGLYDMWGVCMGGLCVHVCACMCGVCSHMCVFVCGVHVCSVHVCGICSHMCVHF